MKIDKFPDNNDWHDLPQQYSVATDLGTIKYEILHVPTGKIYKAWRRHYFEGEERFRLEYRYDENEDASLYAPIEDVKW